MRFVPLAILIALLAAPAAARADVTTIGDGYSPGVAVDAAGTAYIAWIGPEPLANTLQFCKLPRGASACSVKSALKTTGNSLTRPFVAVFGTTVLVAQYRYQEKGGDQQGVYVWKSDNGGTSFGDGVRVGSIPFSDAVMGPGNTLSLVTDAVAEGELFQNVPFDGTGSEDKNQAKLSNGNERPYRGAIGIDGATPLMISTDGSDNAAYRRYKGTGDLEDDKSWDGPTPMDVFAYPHLAGGGAGLFAIGGTAAGREIAARKWTGSGFSAPVVIGPADVPQSHLFQDAGARLHGVWGNFAADGIHLVHAVSDDGTAWRVGTLLVQDVGTDGGIAGPRVATAADHRGVVVWQAGASKKDVRVTEVGPDAPKPVVQVSGSASVQGVGVVINVSGKLVPPDELSKAEGCVGGKVRIQVKRGKKTVLSKAVPVGTNCAYKLKTKVKRSKVKSAKKLSVQARFGGNDALASSARKKSIKVKR